MKQALKRKILAHPASPGYEYRFLGMPQLKFASGRKARPKGIDLFLAAWYNAYQ